ncbi:hypothetical protein, partial [Brevundimonas sp.]|uniref:hypothetical protein n=1 Tax=Brevundimonas sp. TaxID=1871086 RepID=UPI00391F39C0
TQHPLPQVHRQRLAHPSRPPYPVERVNQKPLLMGIPNDSIRSGNALVETPPLLPQLVARYFSAANMSYGVFDLVFERSEILFLECNPEGQWHSANEINLRELVTAFADWNESGRVLSGER